jgi:hypothetical protein
MSKRVTALNNYLRSINENGERKSNRYWLTANTKWGKELIGSVTPFEDGTNIFTGLDNINYLSLDKLLIAFADSYFPQKVEDTNSSINGRRYYTLFGDFKTYDKVEILETGTLLSDIPGIND